MLTISEVTISSAKKLAGAQLHFLACVTIETARNLKTEGFQFKEYVTSLELQSNYSVAKKTIQTNLSISKKLHNKYSVKIEEFIKLDETEAVEGFSSFITNECQVAGYSLARDDIDAMVSGKPSAKAQAEAKRLANMVQAVVASAPKQAPVVEEVETLQAVSVEAEGEEEQASAAPAPAVVDINAMIDQAKVLNLDELEYLIESLTGMYNAKVSALPAPEVAELQELATA